MVFADQKMQNYSNPEIIHPKPRGKTISCKLESVSTHTRSWIHDQFKMYVILHDLYFCIYIYMHVYSIR